MNVFHGSSTLAWAYELIVFFVLLS